MHVGVNTLVQSSGVARLGHTGVRVLAPRGSAPPVQVCMQIIGADSTVVDHKSGARDKVENLLTQVGVRKSCIATCKLCQSFDINKGCS